MCDGQFLANCADRGKLGGDDLDAGDDLADLATERDGKSFTTPGGVFLPGPPLIPCLPVLLKNIANVPMP